MSGKKRLIRLHRALSLIVAITLSVVIAFALFKRSGLLSYQLSSYVNDHYLRGTSFHFSCGKITGDIVGHVSLADPVLRYRAGGRIVEVFRAKRVALDYSLLQVLKLKMLIKKLEVEDIDIRIVEDADGNALLPIPSSSTEPLTSDSQPPHINIESFSIRDLDVAYEVGGQRLHVNDIDLLGALSLIKGDVEFAVHEGSAHLDESDMPVRSLELRGGFGAGGLSIDDLQLRTDRSFVRASGRYDGRFHHVQALLNPLDLEDVSSLGIIDERGEIGGSVVVEGTPDSLAIQGSVTGKAVGLVFSGLALEGVVESRSTVHLTSVSGAVFGSRLNGDVRYDIDSGSYSFQGVCESLNISQGFVNDADVPETDLNGFINLEFDGPTNTYEVRGDLRRSMIEGFVSDIEARLSYNETTGLRIRSARLTRPGFSLSGSGTVNRAGNAEMILALQGDSLDYFMDFVSLPRIGGYADLRGRLIGPLDRFRVNLNGSWNRLSYVLGTIDSSRVNAEALNVGGEDLLATINIDGRHLELGDRVFDKPHLLIRADLEEVVVRDFSFAKGDTFITSHFKMLPGDETQDVLISHLVVRMPHSNWVNEAPAKLVLDEYSATLDTLRMTSIGQQVALLGDYQFEPKRMDIHAWGRGIDLSLIREATDLPYTLKGTGLFSTHVYGDADNPSIDLDVDLRNGLIDSLAFDRLQVVGGFSDEGYYVSRCLVTDRTDSMTLQGSWGYMDSPFKVMNEGFRKNLAAKAPIRIDAASYRYPMVAFFRAIHQRPYWGGAFDGTVTVANTLEAPQIHVAGQLVSRPDDRYKFPAVSTELAYEDGRLDIIELAFDDGNTSASASGVASVRLGLVDGLVFRDDAPIDIGINLASNDLSAVARYFRSLSTSGGKLSGKIRISGSAANPKYSGSVSVNNGLLRVSGTREIYRNVDVDLRLVENDIHLRSLTGDVGKKGKFRAAGSGQLGRFSLDSYDVSLDLENYAFASIRDFESTQDGKLRIRSQTGYDGKPIPSITGQLSVSRAVITKTIGREDGPPSTVGLPTETPGWLASIDIEAPNNVWLRNPDLNMELGGNLIMKRDTLGLYFRGDLSVLRGSYTLYNNKFRITDGRIDFSTATTLRPDIQLSAYTPHRVAGEQEHRIFLDLTWPYDKKEPKIALNYDSPGYSETDLWKMLGGQVVTGDATLGGGGALGTATGTATNLASNYLERVLNAQMSDMTVEVESRPLSGTGVTGTGERELTIAVGRYLSEDLYLKYQQGLTVTSAREVEVEYRISNLFLLRSEIIKHQGSKGIAGQSRRTTDEINFDIKFRVEY